MVRMNKFINLEELGKIGKNIPYFNKVLKKANVNINFIDSFGFTIKLIKTKKGDMIDDWIKNNSSDLYYIHDVKPIMKDWIVHKYIIFKSKQDAMIFKLKFDNTTI